MSCKSDWWYILLSSSSKEEQKDESNKEKTSMINSNSKYYSKKSTSRFTFDMSRNHTAKQAGSNVVTIATNPALDSQYSIGQTALTLTVREAKALQSFLNDSFAKSDSLDI